MKSLAKGTSSDAIFKLIKVLISTQQEDYKVAVQGDTRGLNDVCSQISTERDLFGEQDFKDGTVYNKGLDSPRDDNQDEERAQSPKLYTELEKEIPTKNMILAGSGNDMVNQINTGKIQFPESATLKDLNQVTGWRSSQFDFLLEEQN